MPRIKRCCCAKARMVVVPLIVSRKLLYIGERLTDSIRFSSRELATYSLWKIIIKNNILLKPFYNVFACHTLSVAHFQVAFSLSMKARTSAQMSFICMSMQSHFHMKGWRPRLASRKRLKIIRKCHIVFKFISNLYLHKRPSWTGLYFLRFCYFTSRNEMNRSNSIH